KLIELLSDFSAFNFRFPSLRQPSLPHAYDTIQPTVESKTPPWGFYILTEYAAKIKLFPPRRI
ncbi:MAG TPA: hypothetical protein PK245_05815, partial [Clostridia bacterium]|nr:hypothetical protein [Clostridia bacterium]